MFRRKVENMGDIIRGIMRQEGLETPLRQKRVVDAWEEVAGPLVSRYTQEKFIKNQTLFVKITNPALRSDLSMMRSELQRRLNEKVGGYVISEVKIY